MADRIDHLTERVQVLEDKVDRISTNVDRLSADLGQLASTVGTLASTMDERFKGVDEAIHEQREYTEFCFMHLETKMENGFAVLGAGLSRVERKLDRFIDVQTRANGLVERRLSALE